MLKFILTVFVSYFLAIAHAQVMPYYKEVDFSKSGMELKYELSQLIINTHTRQLPYTSSYYLDAWKLLKSADEDPENASNVLLIYGSNDVDESTHNDRSRSKDLSCHSNSCSGMWVREHVYSKSWGNPNLGTEFAGADAHNLRPVDAQRNISRSNRKFARGIGEARITPQGHWYPGDEWKGDVARMMMYMYLRYPTQCDVKDIALSESTFSLDDDMLDIFLEWNAEDPVSELEMRRNEVIFEYQGNRNPFIDHPYWATEIWNGPEAEKRMDIHENVTSVQQNLLDTISVYKNGSQIYIRGLEDNSILYELYGTDGKLLQQGRVTDRIDLLNDVTQMHVLKLKFGQLEIVKLIP